MKIEKFDSLESTNKYCEALDLAQVEDFTCYWALEQTAGIGQRGNHWASAPGENLTFSLVLHPTFLPADRQFKLTQALSLAICDFLSPLTSHLSPFTFHLSPLIKWPNDIYVAGKKICGTLVSTRLVGNSIASAICGIGFNVNQREFPDWVLNPTSLSLLTGVRYELEPLLRRLLQCIEVRYNALKAGADAEQEYLARLLNLGVPARYKLMNIQSGSSPKIGEGWCAVGSADNPSEARVEEYVTATITGVDLHGRLLLTTSDGRHISCGMKEIALLS